MTERAGVDGPTDTAAGTPADTPAGDAPGEPGAARTATGLPAVDRVLDELDGLEDLPVSEHLPAFERAHSSLRAALDDELDTRRESGPAEPA